MLKFFTNKILLELDKYNISLIYEIRIRKNKHIQINYNGNYIFLNYICREEDIKQIINKVCNYSVYSFQDYINKGYVTTQYGIRIGIAGEFVYTQSQISCVKNITSLVIRIPHQVDNCTKNMQHILQNELQNIFIASPPGFGKTTFLRDLTKFLSLKNKNVVVIDEKFEIIEKNYNYKLGECVDVLWGIKKEEGISFAIKNLKPDVIILDEISSLNECQGVYNAVNSGVKVICSAHADDLNSLIAKPLFKKFFYDKTFNYYVFLGKKIGKICGIYNCNGELVN